MKTSRDAVDVPTAEMRRAVRWTTGGGCGLVSRLDAKTQRTGGLQVLNVAWAVRWPEYHRKLWWNAASAVSWTEMCGAVIGARVGGVTAVAAAMWC